MTYTAKDSQPPGQPRHALGIGAQKAASTWLHDVVARHPDVSVPPVKEIDFFSYHHDRGHAWYRSCFPGDGLRFENSPSYLHDPRSPRRARAFDPGMRIVLTLRDPVDRAFSHHLHEIAKGHIAARPFAEAVLENPDYLEQGYYAHHLDVWQSAFPGRQIAVLFAEDIRRDPGTALRRVWDHLDLRHVRTTQVISERRNRSDQARLAWLRHMMRSGGQGLRRLGLEEHLVRLKRLAPVRRLLDWNSMDLRNVVPPLTLRERAGYARMFEEDMRALADMLGLETLPWPSWRFTQIEPLRRPA